MDNRVTSALLVPILVTLLVAEVAAQGIEEIVVTAQKREQNVNDVPLAISAYSRQTVTDLGILSAEDMEQLTPGLEVNSTGGVGTKVWSIRGVGFNDYSTSASSTVGLYFDEVAIPYPVMATGPFFDTARVEVLKGPQGDLYGRNTTGGQINFISEKPTDSYESGIRVGVGSFESVDLKGFLSGPLGESARARIAVATTQRAEGWQESLSRPGDKLGEIDRIAARAILEFDAGENASVLLNVHFNNDQSDNLAPTAFDGTLVGLPFPTRRGPPFNAAGELEPAAIFSTGDNEAADWTNGVNNELRPRRDNQLSGASLRITSDIGDVELVSLTAFDQFERDERNDWDGTALNDSSNINVTDIDVFSQEFRVAGGDDSVNWVVGAYFATDDLSEDYNYFFGEGRFGIAQLDTNYVQETDSAAAFGRIEWDLSDRVGAIIGLRYTSEDRDWSGCTNDATPVEIDLAGSPGPNLPLTVFLNNIINGPGVITPNGLFNDAFNTPNGLPALTDLAPNGCSTFNDILGSPGVGQYGVFAREISADELMWRVGVNFAPTDETLWFFNVSQGFKSGGFNGANSNTHSQLIPYGIEKLLSYEAGVKATLADGTVQFNGSAFFYDYTDKQERNPAVTPVGNISGLTNVPKSKIVGADFDLTWEPTDRFSLYTGVSLLDTEIEEWLATDELASVYPNVVLFDASGRELPNAPQFSGNLTAAYAFAISGRLSLTTAFDIIHRGDTAGPVAPENAREAYTVANARVTIAPSDGGSWAVQLWSRNVFDEDYYVSGQTGGNFTVTRINGLPRTWGVTVDMRFE